jgi:hypothetical protein
MLGAQTLDPSTQREIPPPRPRLPARYELGNFELQPIPRASEERQGYTFGLPEVGSSDRANLQRQLRDVAATEGLSPSINGEALWKNLPDELQEIAKEITSSRYILDLEAEDEVAAKPYSEATWRRAATLLARMCLSLFTEDRERIAAPKILPGPEGSIDIHWDKADYELLINIPADPGASAAFYGDNRAKSKIKGSFDADKESDTPLLAYRTLRDHRAK